MTRYLLLSLLLLAAGCAMAPAVETTKIADECVRHSYSRNLWWPNWDRVDILDVDASGECHKRREIHTVTARDAFGQKAGAAFAGGAPIGIGLGLMRFNQTWTNNQIGMKDPHISTYNDNVKYVPVQ